MVPDRLGPVLGHTGVGFESRVRLTLLDPSITIIANSSSCPPSPPLGAAAALTLLLWAASMDGATPVLPSPWVRAATPPVRISLAVSTPTALRALNRGNLFLKDLSLWFSTIAFLLVPAARPTPRLLTLRVCLMPWGLSAITMAAPRLGLEADTTDLACETSIPSWWILLATKSLKPPSSFTICSSLPSFSLERSSTKRVGVTVGWHSRAASTMLIITMRISVVAPSWPR